MFERGAGTVARLSLSFRLPPRSGRGSRIIFGVGSRTVGTLRGSGSIGMVVFRAMTKKRNNETPMKESER